MKKILRIALIVLLSSFIFNSTYAKEWFIENFLDLNEWVEKLDIELVNIDNIYFKNENTQNTFDLFKKTSETLKNEIIRKYEKWDFDYYQTKWIITNYKLFVYHTNEYFKYKKLKEKYPNEQEVDDFILKNYSLMRVHFNRIKQLIY